jgi:hypothetical protein
MLNQPLSFGLKRKIDKLEGWESKHPKTRATSEHAARLESRAGTLGTYSYRKITKCLQFEYAPVATTTIDAYRTIYCDS